MIKAFLFAVLIAMLLGAVIRITRKILSKSQDGIQMVSMRLTKKQMDRIAGGFLSPEDWAE